VSIQGLLPEALIDQFAQNVYIPISNQGREEGDISSLGF
jgi:hypothetical protein